MNFHIATRFSGLVLASLILGATLLTPSPAVADPVAAQAAFDRANAAFRSGDYEAALADYNEALAGGKDSPRLFYNMGLAHYRLGQYSQAQWAFMEAQKDDRMAALAQYQLGVLAKREVGRTVVQALAQQRGQPEVTPLVRSRPREDRGGAAAFRVGLRRRSRSR